jgi:hypothetical protein
MGQFMEMEETLMEENEDLIEKVGLLEMEWSWFKTLNRPRRIWKPKILLGNMFKVFAIVAPIWIRVNLYPWFGLGVLRCTSEIVGCWVNETLGQICWLFEGYWWLKLGF